VGKALWVCQSEIPVTREGKGSTDIPATGALRIFSDGKHSRKSDIEVGGCVCWQDGCPSFRRAAGGGGRVLCLCSVPSGEHGLGNPMWERGGLRHRRAKSRRLEQSCHEHGTRNTQLQKHW